MGAVTTFLDPLLHDATLVYVGLFLAALIDATGLPFPGRVLLVASGAAAATEWRHVAGLVVAGALGALAGDHVWWVAGRAGAGERLTELYCKLSLASRACERKARDRFERFGAFAIVVGRFVAGVRFVSMPMAGGGLISYPRFLLFDALGALAWSGVFVGLGYALGEQWRALADRYGVMTPVLALAALTLGGVGAIVAIRLVRLRRHGRAAAPARVNGGYCGTANSTTQRSKGGREAHTRE